jgi:hypothetical protein
MCSVSEHSFINATAPPTLSSCRGCTGLQVCTTRVTGTSCGLTRRAYRQKTDPPPDPVLLRSLLQLRRASEPAFVMMTGNMASIEDWGAEAGCVEALAV